MTLEEQLVRQRRDLALLQAAYARHVDRQQELSSRVLKTLESIVEVSRTTHETVKLLAERVARLEEYS